MGTRIIEGTEFGTEQTVAVLYDSVTGWAFGPVFVNAEWADEFLIWLESEAPGVDPRTMSPIDLERHYKAWPGPVEEAS